MCISYNFPVSQNIILSLTFSQPLKNLFLADAPYTNRRQASFGPWVGFPDPRPTVPRDEEAPGDSFLGESGKL